MPQRKGTITRAERAALDWVRRGGPAQVREREYLISLMQLSRETGRPYWRIDPQAERRYPAVSLRAAHRHAAALQRAARAAARGEPVAESVRRLADREVIDVRPDEPALPESRPVTIQHRFTDPYSLLDRYVLVQLRLLPNRSWLYLLTALAWALALEAGRGDSDSIRAYRSAILTGEMPVVLWG